MEHHYPERKSVTSSQRGWCFVECHMSHIHFFVMASETPRIYAMFGVYLHLELKNATTHSEKTGSLQIYGFKRAGDHIVSILIQLEYAVCILVTA